MSRSACVHCGLPVRVTRAPAGQAFCCHGCRLAHRLWSHGDAPVSGAEKSLLARLMLSIFFAMASMMFTMALAASAVYPSEAPAHALGPLAPLLRWLALAFAAPVLLLLGWPLFRSMSFMNATIAIGVTAAFGLSVVNAYAQRGEVYVETVTMTLVLVTLGRYLDAQARRRATSSLQDLLRLDPQEAWRLVPGSVEGDSRRCERVLARELRHGDHLRVHSSERVPTDGTVEQSTGAADESILTGELEPRRLEPGDGVLAGSLVVDGTIEMCVQRVYGERLLDRMAELAQTARDRRMPLERLTETASRWFLPVPLLVAAAAAAWWGIQAGPEKALTSALSVLLIACPCALGVAAPLATWVAIGRAAQRGVLVRGGEVFEKLAGRCRFFLDKTGTITVPTLEVSRIEPARGRSEEVVLRIASALAQGSSHPAARAVCQEAERRALVGPRASSITSQPGLGITGVLAGQGVALGNQRLIAALGDHQSDRSELPAASLWVASENQFLGSIVLGETVRPEAPSVFRELAARGHQLSVLTGDTRERGLALSQGLGIVVEPELLPNAKLDRIVAERRQGQTTVMVGDGVNDAPTLAAADVGIALASGADLARDAADVVILDTRAPLAALPYLLHLAQRTTRNIRRSLLGALVYNLAGMAFAFAGYVHPVLAAGLMTVSSLCVVAGALAGGNRATSSKEWTVDSVSGALAGRSAVLALP